MMMFNDNLYSQNYRTRSFSEIFPESEDFTGFYNDCGIPPKFKESSTALTLYYLLLSRYANSHIASSDEERFKYEMMQIIFRFGPTWEKQLEIQDSLRALTDDQITLGNKQIFNHAYNPSSDPSTGSTQELNFINEQNVTTNKRGKLEAYANLNALLERDVTGDFLNQFKKLFTTFTPECPIRYLTHLEEGEDL